MDVLFWFSLAILATYCIVIVWRWVGAPIPECFIGTALVAMLISSAVNEMRQPSPPSVAKKAHFTPRVE